MNSFILSMLLIVITIKTYAQNSTNRNLILSSFPKNLKLILKKDNGINLETVDSITIKSNGSVEILTLKDTSIWFYKLENDSINFYERFISDGDVNIEYDSISKKNKTTFSESSFLFKKYIQNGKKWVSKSVEMSKLIDSLDNIMNPASTVMYKSINKSISDSMNNDESSFFYNNSSNFLCLYIFSRKINYENLTKLDSMFNSIGENLKPYSFFKMVQNRFKTRVLSESARYLPPISLRTFQKNKIIDFSKLKTRYLLIDFWGTWCKPCINDFSNLKIIQKKYKNKSFEIIGIANEFSGDSSSFRKKLKDFNIKWETVFIFTRENELNIISSLKINIYPSYLLINRKGEILKRTTNLVEIENYLENSLSH